MKEELQKLSGQLSERLSKEDGRPPAAPGTVLVGGVVTAGRILEKLLRAAVVEVSRTDGIDPTEIVGRGAGRPRPMSKATAGELAHGLKNFLHRRQDRSVSTLLDPLTEDLLARSSRILNFIKVRNEVAKEGKEPKTARAAVKQLHQLMLSFRRNAGWE